MGKTPKKFQCEIWVDPEYVDLPEVKELAEKGHKIVPLLAGAQLILSRTAHAWTPEMFEIKGLLELAIKRNRKREK